MLFLLILRNCTLYYHKYFFETRRLSILDFDRKKDSRKGSPSCRAESNRRPPPYQGDALPTEPRQHAYLSYATVVIYNTQDLFVNILFYIFYSFSLSRIFAVLALILWRALSTVLGLLSRSLAIVL